MGGGCHRRSWMSSSNTAENLMTIGNTSFVFACSIFSACWFWDVRWKSAWDVETDVSPPLQATTFSSESVAAGCIELEGER